MAADVRWETHRSHYIRTFCFLVRNVTKVLFPAGMWCFAPQEKKEKKKYIMQDFFAVVPTDQGEDAYCFKTTLRNPTSQQSDENKPQKVQST